MERKKITENIQRNIRNHLYLIGLISLGFLSSCGFFDGGVTYGVERGNMAACGTIYTTKIEKGDLALIIADRRFPIVGEERRVTGFDVNPETGYLTAGVPDDLDRDTKEDFIVGYIKDGVATFETVCSSSNSDQK